MLPKVVIAGRPNVGKSSLLNALARRKVSIVDATAGVTRDRVATLVELPPPEGIDPACEAIELIDTGGYGVVDQQHLEAEVERQIATGLAEADVVLFVVDAQQGITPLDEAVADLLRKSLGDRPVVTIANKVDGESLEAQAYEAMSLGLGEIVLASATTGHNRPELINAVHEAIHRSDWRRRAEADRRSENDRETGLLIALVGKRNAGKSTLVNALAGQERVIVSEQQGTTRDSVDVRFEMDGRVFTAIDTAGLRRGRSVKQDLEYYAQHRALRSIRRADVCLLLIDAAEPVSAVDKKLGQEILRHHRPTVIVVNKWDLASEQATQEDYAEYLDKELKGFTFAPIVFTSATEKTGLAEAVAVAENLYAQTQHRVGTGELNRFIETVTTERGPVSRHGKRAKIYYASQVATDPPTIALFVNDPELIDQNYQRFLLNRMRDELPFSEVPIKLFIRGKPKMTAAERIETRGS
ncbi:MAG: ribosome biogenesis GTPase Der [Phycisphaeraceae bacterium]